MIPIDLALAKEAEHTRYKSEEAEDASQEPHGFFELEATTHFALLGLTLPPGRAAKIPGNPMHNIPRQLQQR
jgi:hypothetical protein